MVTHALRSSRIDVSDAYGGFEQLHRASLEEGFAATLETGAFVEMQSFLTP